MKFSASSSSRAIATSGNHRFGSFGDFKNNLKLVKLKLKSTFKDKPEKI
jgi:hypothetical protein